MKLVIDGKLHRAKLVQDGGRAVLMADGRPVNLEDVWEIYLADATAAERRALRRAGYYIPPEPWGLRLRRLRETAGMTQQDLARALNVKQSVISNLEARLSPPNSLTLLEKLKTALGGDI